MIDKNSIEAAYSFFHQKWRVYAASNIESQKDDIEYAISNYVNGMSPELYKKISGNRKDFLCDHRMFSADMQSALNQLSHLILPPQD